MPVYPVAASRNRNFGVATPFVGAYDTIPNIVAAYGMRRLRTAYTGSILRVRRSSDNAEQNIGYESDGDLDTAAVASFIGGGSGYFVRWYDQSSNGYDASQMTAASQPLYVASGQNGRPVGRFDGVDDFLNADVPVGTGPITVIITYKFNGTVLDNWQWIISGDTSYCFIGKQSGSAKLHAGWSGTSWQAHEIANSNGFDGEAHILSWVFGAGNVKILENGTVRESTTYSGTPVNQSGLGIGYRRDSSSEMLNSDIDEFIICNAALSDANRQAAEAAANQYFAIY